MMKVLVTDGTSEEGVACLKGVAIRYENLCSNRKNYSPLSAIMKD